MASLAELLLRDLSQADRDELVRGVKHAEMIRDAAPAWSGRFIAMLRRQDLTWSEIVKLTGLPQTTAYSRAEPFL